ncbi:Gfo/Idh/MocA family oxidoreductase [Streptomyces scabiei]|uniref:Gfo/Idh/MocA family oxidoreductase n=1 Tax=Streptomyces scabiei TaxID=1930 RepID=UPI001B33F79B|nr:MULTISPECIES: Gfo/Idh/MocA family oxidoreductase [unclassified Streptomyces]
MNGAGCGPLRVVVCGTRFGQVYLSALRRCPERYRLVGVVARGGARSVALAEEYGVPLYSSVDQLPGTWTSPAWWSPARSAAARARSWPGS